MFDTEKAVMTLLPRFIGDVQNIGYRAATLLALYPPCPRILNSFGQAREFDRRRRALRHQVFRVNSMFPTE